jgi:hypothetical protein
LIKARKKRRKPWKGLGETTRKHVLIKSSDRMSFSTPFLQTYQSFILEACSLATSSLNCQIRNMEQDREDDIMRRTLWRDTDPFFLLSSVPSLPASPTHNIDDGINLGAVLEHALDLQIAIMQVLVQLG